MRFFTACLCLIVFSFSLFAQTPEQVLATANGRQFTVKELPPDVSEAYVNLSKKVAETRAALLEQQIIETVFETEAKTKNLTIEKYLDQIKKQAAAPTEKEIQTVYDANRAAIGTRTLAEVRPQIVAFLREESENKALANTFDALKNKYKITPGKDVNALSLRPVDVLATVGAKPLTVKDYEEKNKITLYETKAKVFDTVKFALNELIYNELVAAEAKSLNVSSSDVVAREVSDKLREFTAEERSELETALRRKLSTKYKAQILLTEPVPVRLDVTTENAASRGSSTAPVTVVMFSDFQCSACAAAHPALKKVLAEYGDQVRFVVRNYPLMSIHPNAYPAALAARAAFAQGKFFEYAEILYRNQEALDAASLKRYAVEAGLNLQQFELDLQSEKTAAAVRRDMQDGGNYGINATPTVYVNGVKARVITTDGFREAIDKALRK